MSSKESAKSRLVTGWVKFSVGWKGFWKRVHADKLEPVFILIALILAVLFTAGSEKTQLANGIIGLVATAWAIAIGTVFFKFLLFSITRNLFKTSRETGSKVEWLSVLSTVGFTLVMWTYIAMMAWSSIDTLLAIK